MDDEKFVVLPRFSVSDVGRLVALFVVYHVTRKDCMNVINCYHAHIATRLNNKIVVF